MLCQGPQSMHHVMSSVHSHLLNSCCHVPALLSSGPPDSLSDLNMEPLSSGQLRRQVRSSKIQRCDTGPPRSCIGYMLSDLHAEGTDTADQIRIGGAHPSSNLPLSRFCSCSSAIGDVAGICFNRHHISSCRGRHPLRSCCQAAACRAAPAEHCVAAAPWEEEVDP